MYAGNGADYFRAGLSAVDCIDHVLRAVDMSAVESVLDLPSGYGRELRFLICRFPQATFTACDIQHGAVDFCANAFGALPAYSKPDLADLSFERKFDLVWSGSLVTHLDSTATLALLRLFSRHLNKGGVAIVTTNGEFVAEQMRNGASYDLQPEFIAPLLRAYVESGYGYRDYSRGQGYFEFHPAGTGYGVSLTAPETIRSLAKEAELETVYFKERGWANHQDVFAFRKLGEQLAQG
jgi:SAM-dependent methyltransferase